MLRDGRGRQLSHATVTVSLHSMIVENHHIVRIALIAVSRQVRPSPLWPGHDRVRVSCCECL